MLACPFSAPTCPFSLEFGISHDDGYGLAILRTRDESLTQGTRFAISQRALRHIGVAIPSNIIRHRFILRAGCGQCRLMDHSGVRAYDYLMILTMRKWRDGQAVPADTTGQLPSREVDEGELLWVDLADPTPAELRSIGKHFGLTPLGMADVLEPHERTKVVRHPDHLSFVCYAAVGDTSNDNEDQA